MTRKLGKVLVGLCGLAIATACSAPVFAQMSEVKEKPPMYSYVGNWAIPRAQWGEMEKNTAADTKVLDKAIAAGTIVGYGSDVNLVHEADGPTHDDWWSATSLAGVINVLEQFYQSGGASASVLSTATKHYDTIYVSRYYNWHPGSYKNVYTRVGEFKLKADAPDDALETMSKNFFVPLFEKLLADGVIHEYEIDEQAIHSDAPGTFIVVCIAANAEGLDKVNEALRGSVKTNPLLGPAIGSMVDFTVHRDYLARTNATYK